MPVYSSRERLARFAGVALGFLALAQPPLVQARAGVEVRDHLYSVDFVSAQEAWAVGGFGTILHTTDQGETWMSEHGGTLEHLFGVDFADAEHGWAVGRAGTILHRDSSGTWKRQNSGSDRHFFQVAAVTSSQAWVVGDWGVMLTTGDGGQTWSDRSLAEDVILNDITFADEHHGWMVGEFGAVFVTDDGGATWARQESGIDKTLFGVDFVDVRKGWAVGLDGVMIRTEDGGRSWTLERGKPTSTSLERMGFLEALTNPSLYAVDVAGSTGVAVGDMGTILVSRDGGLTWKREHVPSEWALRWVRSLALVSGSGTDGLLVGSGGLAIPISNGEFRFPNQ